MVTGQQVSNPPLMSHWSRVGNPPNKWIDAGGACPHIPCDNCTVGRCIREPSHEQILAAQSLVLPFIYIAHRTAPMQEWHGSFLGPVRSLHTYARVPEGPKV